MSRKMQPGARTQVQTRTKSTYLALQEVQTAVLRQNGGWRFAGVAGDVVADVFSQYTFNIFLGEAIIPSGGTGELC